MYAKIIGVNGGSASGKTTFVNKLYSEFKNDIVVISHDSYYKDFPELSIRELEKINYGHPNTLDTKLLIEHLIELRNGKAIEQPVYSFEKYAREPFSRKIYPAKIIIVEGVLIFENQELRNLMDLKIFLEVDSNTRLSRRIARDLKERNRSLEVILSQYIESVEPMYKEFVEPYKKYADIIIPNNSENLIGIELVKNYIHSILA